MNEQRKIYLSAYGVVDIVDHMIKIAMIRYICLKWWHFPASHGKRMGVATAYEMYMDCALGHLLPVWKNDNIMG
eukprot:11569335-Ditylum_brightwellii.AAC.1